MITDGILTDYSRVILQSCENAAPLWQKASCTGEKKNKTKSKKKQHPDTQTLLPPLKRLVVN